MWTWLLLLYFIPIFGFIFYLLVGTDMHKKRMFKIKEIEDHLNEAIRRQEDWLQDKRAGWKSPEITEYADLALYNLGVSGAVLTDDNDITVFTDGKEKFEALMEDMRQAQKYIHVQYYIIKNDVLFQQMKDVLVEKAAQGVEVRILYDGMGGRFVNKKCWRELNRKGIRTAEFFPALWWWTGKSAMWAASILGRSISDWMKSSVIGGTLICALWVPQWRRWSCGLR